MSFERARARTAGVTLTGAVAALAATASVLAAPAEADTTSDFLDAIGSAGVGLAGAGSVPGAGQLPDRDQAVALGQSVCPMLAQPGQTAADAAAQVAQAGGMSLGPATMFTGLAISAFCPGAVSAIGNGNSPIPLGLLGL